MPILEKHGQRVLFAHIPKTAGTSIYLAFAAAGWRILNLSENPEPSDEEIRIGLSGNLCRCTGYARIIAAVQATAVELRT